MKKTGAGEYYSASDNTGFSEYKVFKAEEYYEEEIKKTADEDFSVSEFGTDTPSVTHEENSIDTQRLQEEASKMNQPTSSSSSSTTASNSTNAVAESTAGVSGATASTVVTAAAVAVVVTSTIAVGLSINEINREIGANYISLGMNLGDFAKADESSGEANREYKWHLSAEGETELTYSAIEGDHNYLFANLSRNKEYKVTLQSHGHTTESETYFEETFKTAEVSTPTALYDEFNSGFSFDYANKEVSFDYSIFVSDIDSHYDSYATRITSGDLQEENTVLESDSFVRGTVSGHLGDVIQIKTLGFTGAGDTVLLDKTITVPYPEGWEYPAPPSYYAYTFGDPISVDETPNTLNIIGNVSGDSTIKEYKFALSLFDDKDSLKKTINGDVGIESGIYVFGTDLPYGVNKYSYEISFIDDKGSTITAYSSQQYSLAVSQEYGATYNQIGFGEDGCTVTYYGTGDNVIVNIETGFDAGEYDSIFALRGSIVSLDSGEVIDTKTVTSSTMEFDFPRTDEELAIRYEDIGYFEGEEHVYATHNKSKTTTFGLPSLTLGESLSGHDGEIYLPFTSDIPSNLSDVCAEIDVVQEGTTITTLSEVDISESGEVVVPDLINYSGTVTFNTKLLFTHEATPIALQEIALPSKDYVIPSVLSVSNVIFDVTDSVIGAKMDITYAVAGANSIAVVDTRDYDTHLYEGALASSISFSGVPDDATEIAVQILDSSGTSIKEVAIPFSKPDTSSLDYTFSCPNPGDAVVTYNDDGTVNIYRDLLFEDRSGGISWATVLYGYDEDTYETIERYITTGTSRYSAMEDIDNSSFLGLLYYLDYEPNGDGIKYRFFEEMPSGGIDPLDSEYSISLTRDTQTSSSTGETEYVLSAYFNGYTKNEFFIDGEAHQFDTFETDCWDTFKYTSSEDFIGLELTFYYTSYSATPESLGDIGIPIKGERFAKITKTIA